MLVPVEGISACERERERERVRERESEREREHSPPFLKYFYNRKPCGRWAIMGVSLLEQNIQFNEEILGSNGGTDGEGREKETAGMVRAH